MKIGYQTHMRDILDKTFVSTKGVFKSYVVEGIENWNSKKVYMASISGEHRSSTGYFYTTFEEAERESFEILEEMYNKLEEDKIKWREESSRNNLDI